MSFYNLYVGDATDPKFQWDGADFSYNTPKTILDLGGIGLTGCVEARILLKSPKYGGKVLDWGSCGARLTKERIIELLHEYNGPLWRPGFKLAKKGDRKSVPFHTHSTQRGVSRWHNMRNTEKPPTQNSP